MKRVATLVLTLSIALFMSADAMAERRDNGKKGGNRREHVTAPRPGSGYSRPGYGNNNNNGKANTGNSGNVRPGHGGGKPSPGTKPTPGIHPGGGNTHKPSYGSGHRPEFGNSVGHRPGFRPSTGRPGGMRPPTHAGFRPGGAWHRPVPPVGWRPGRRVPVFRSVLGVNFGVSLTLSLRSLMASNYAVSGYGNNEVYLTNVPMQGFYWPNATLYYANDGLVGSQFVYATPGYDMSRYNVVYNSLYNAYGAPVSVNGAQVTWFGGNNEFVTLNFSPVYSGGSSSFYTTLSFGI